MVLHREDGMIAVYEPLQRPVVEVDVGGRSADEFQRGGIDREPVVLRGDLDTTRAQVLDRLIGSTVTELQFERTRPQRQTQQLVPQANAKDRHSADQSFDKINGVVDGSGIAGTIADEDPLGFAIEHVTNVQHRIAQLERYTIELYQAFQNDNHWAAIGAIADSLLAHETLDEDMLQEIVEPWMGEA